MGSTTIRVDDETHARLLALAKESGASLTKTVGDAAEALRRQRFAKTVTDEFAALRHDEQAWVEYISDAQASEVSDGIG